MHTIATRYILYKQQVMHDYKIYKIGKAIQQDNSNQASDLKLHTYSDNKD